MPEVWGMTSRSDLPQPAREVVVRLPAEHFAEIQDASGVLSVEAFLRRSGLEKARRLLSSSLPRDRYGAVPQFGEGANDA